MAIKFWSLILSTALLGACSSQEDDVHAWMDQEAAGMKGGVKPLPQVQSFPPVDYDAVALVPPFDPNRLAVDKKSASSNGPDVNRRREPLESFPLESLKLVGVMEKGRATHAVIKAGNSLFQARVGNYMGQNFGLVTKITESEVTLRELVEDLNGEWTERTSSLQLQEQEAKK
ncbi:MAG: pilus assembly protein PilP [Zoogloeaceae bacterium]|nr:pilus assembly protein PilP [Zoogloeaceae bacterium]